MQQQELIPHLFRTEFRKISSVLCKHFGIEHLEIAEDITSETFLSALEIWTYKGLPANPTAWLYTVAKNKTKNYLARSQIYNKKISVEIKRSSIETQDADVDLSDKNISDSQLQMLFALCHPSIPAESQISLALRILCGFGIEEIANAFLTKKETVNKRLFRAKEKLREEKIAIEVPPQAEIPNRLDSVLTTLYLLFSEGYYSESQDTVLREELCLEAMRLTLQLLEYEQTNLPKVNALFSLMCFHASRFKARKDSAGQVVLYQDQDESLWNQELIAKGAYYLRAASQGRSLSKYHLEASIAYWHTIKSDSKEKWDNILQLYNKLLQIEYSPIAALNRTFALSKVHGNSEAIKEAEKLKLADNQYYFTLLGELYTGSNNTMARQNFEKAILLAKTLADKQIIQKKIDKL